MTYDPSKETIDDFAAFVKNTPIITNASVQTERTENIQATANVAERSKNGIILPATIGQNEELQRYKELFGFHSASELAKPSTPKPYLIKDWIKEGALHLLFGDSGIMKTFAVLDMACAIACPTVNEWARMKTKTARVLYLAGEGQEGIKRRYNGWLQAHDANPATMQFDMFDAVFTLNDAHNKQYSTDNIIKAIKLLCDEPKLIIVDTLARYFDGSENDTEDMNRFVNSCTKITREIDSAILIISHTGHAKENKTRVRGSSALFGACDIVIKAEGGGKSLTLDQTKHKDGRKQKGLILDSEEVALSDEWNNDDGESITTLIMNVSPFSRHDSPDAQKQQAKKEKLTASQVHTRNTFKEAVKRFGVRLHDENTQHDLAAVYIEDWRKVSYDMSSADKEDSKRVTFSRQRKQLLEAEQLLTKRTIEGREYYCLDLALETESDFRYSVMLALNAQENQKQ